ncbi:hypothetical protein [Dyella agri]|uniref:Uncharacterized protein n=1 Tax=Dyella agri TaxID=1926869 RepID=A0ABW8KD62_9GAMM
MRHRQRGARIRRIARHLGARESRRLVVGSLGFRCKFDLEDRQRRRTGIHIQRAASHGIAALAYILAGQACERLVFRLRQVHVGDGLRETFPAVFLAELEDKPARGALHPTQAQARAGDVAVLDDVTRQPVKRTRSGQIGQPATFDLDLRVLWRAAAHRPSKR